MPPSLALLARVASKSKYTCTTIYELICMIQSHNWKVHLCVGPLVMTYVYEVPFYIFNNTAKKEISTYLKEAIPILGNKY